MLGKAHGLFVALWGTAAFACGSAGGSDEGTAPDGATSSSGGATVSSATMAGSNTTSAATTSSGGANGVAAVAGGAGGTGGAASGAGGVSSVGGAPSTDGDAGSGGVPVASCEHQAFFQPASGQEELSIGAFCDELFVCLPDGAAVTAAEAVVPELSCAVGENVFQNLEGASCESAEFVCQWFMVYDVDQDDLDALCEVTSLTPEVDPVLCRVYL